MRDNAGILSEHTLMFEGPEGRMTLEAAAARGYEIRRYDYSGMMGHSAFGCRDRLTAQQAALQNELAYRERERHFAMAAGLQSMNAPPAVPEPQVGDVQPGETRYMGTPCALPREGLKVRLTRYMQRGKRWASRS